MSNHKNNHKHSHRQPRISPYKTEQDAAVQEACMECAQCAGTIHPLHAMGIPMVTEQEVLMEMLRRTNMPFTFAPTDETPDDKGTIVAVHLPVGGGPFLVDGDGLDLMFFFNEHGTCIDTQLA